MPSQLLFFDLDDTLLDHRGAEEAAQRETFEAFAKHLNGTAFEAWLGEYQTVNRALWDAFGRREVTRDELKYRRFHEPLAALGHDGAHADAMSDFYLAAYARHWRLNEGAEEILAAATELGTVGILSNGLLEAQKAKVERFRLDRWASHFVFSEEVGAMKPAREIFDAAWERAARREPVRRVYLGDSIPHDVVGAKNAGWLPILYSPNGHEADFPVLYVRRLVDARPLLE